MDDVGAGVKVLYFTLGFGPHDRRFLEALVKTGNRIHYLPLLDPETKRYLREIPAGVSRHPALLGPKDFRLYRYRHAVKGLQVKISQIQPNLIHAGPIHQGAAISAMASDLPLVSMSWGSDLLWNARKLWTALAARYALQRTDAFVGDCMAVKEAAVRLGMDEERIVLFPWGTDLKHFSPGSNKKFREELKWEKAFILISTRSFEPLYGVDLIVKAFVKVAPEEPNLRLLLLGDGSQRSRYQKRLDVAGLHDRVHFQGHVSREQLPAYYRAADLYLSASYSDGSSVSLLEAMACGLPALVSDISGNCEWVKAGINGWLFRSGQLESLIANIRTILGMQESLQAVGKTARKVAEQRADWEVNFPKLLEAYDIAMSHSHQAAK